MEYSGVENINERLEELKTEDFIWIIYVAIIFLSWIANSLERKYFLFNDLMSKEKYREIMIIIFSILVIVYFYFYKESVSDINKLKDNDTDKKKILTIISSIASLLILISGIIFLIVAILDEDLDVELAFN